MAFLFEKLEVYPKAVDFAYQAGEMTEGFPRGSLYLADQLRRAALSIATNIAEGNGRFNRADRISFTGMVAELESVSKMLSGLVKA